MKKIDVTQVEFTEEDIKKALRRPEYFMYFGENKEMFQTWALGVTIQHRDSEAGTRSNAIQLKKALEEHPEWEEQWESVECNHAAVGWVEHLSYQVVNEDGTPTDVAKFLKEWFDYLKNDYPYANEDHVSELEEEERSEWYTHATSAHKAHTKALKHDMGLHKPTVRFLKKNFWLLYSIVSSNDNEDVYDESWTPSSRYSRDDFAKELRAHHRYAYREKQGKCVCCTTDVCRWAEPPKEE